MKKLTLFLSLFLLLLLSLAGCSKEHQESGGEGLRVVTTSYPLYDFAREIGGEEIKVELLLPPGAEVHTFEPTPSDLKKITQSDLFLYVGGHSDAWIHTMLSSTDLPDEKILSFIDKVDALKEEQSASMAEDEHDHEEDHNHEEGHDEEKEEYDEHIWLSLDHAEKIVHLISGKFQEMDKEHAPLFKEREKKYVDKLAALKKEYASMVAGAKRKEIIVGDRFPFLYLTKSLGINYDAAYPGCSANVEENAQSIKGLIDKVKEKQIPVVFSIEMSQGRIADRIVEATGAKKRMLHSIQNISKEEVEADETYLSLMKKNLDALKEALY